MNCWKSINLTKEYGLNRLYLISLLVGIMAFVFLYVPFSMMHGKSYVNDTGVYPLIILLLMLPTIHSFMHILPLIMVNRRIKLICKIKGIFLPVFLYQTRVPLSRELSLIVIMAPTILITLPGIFAAYVFTSFYVYILLFTSVHIGLSMIDFFNFIHITRAPKKSVIENGNDGFDILVKGH